MDIQENFQINARHVNLISSNYMPEVFINGKWGIYESVRKKRFLVAWQIENIVIGDQHIGWRKHSLTLKVWTGLKHYNDDHTILSGKNDERSWSQTKLLCLQE